jgi:hypothetical protein
MPTNSGKAELLQRNSLAYLCRRLLPNRHESGKADSNSRCMRLGRVRDICTEAQSMLLQTHSLWMDWFRFCFVKFAAAPLSQSMWRPDLNPPSTWPAHFFIATMGREYLRRARHVKTVPRIATFTMLRNPKVQVVTAMSAKNGNPCLLFQCACLRRPCTMAHHSNIYVVFIPAAVADRERTTTTSINNVLPTKVAATSPATHHPLFIRTVATGALAPDTLTQPSPPKSRPPFAWGHGAALLHV